MLFIFRKLRRSFFLPGKVRTYLAYAAGEIVLIVVGILLALQVSDWQQKRQLKKQEALYLDRITIELDQAANTYADQISQMEENRDEVRYVMNSLIHGHLQDEKTFASGIFSADVLRTIDHPITIYDEMISTGNFSRLRDETLRNLLIQLKTSYDASVHNASLPSMTDSQKEHLPSYDLDLCHCLGALPKYQRSILGGEEALATDAMDTNLVSLY